MKIQRFAALAVLLTTASTASTAFAHGEGEHAKPVPFDATKVEVTAFGQQGDPGKATRTIAVDMTDGMRFTPSQLTVKRGETVRFVVRNDGRVLHEMVLGTKKTIAEHAELMKRFPEMEHADPNMAHVRPGQNGEIVWKFTKTGEFQFACLQPGHFEAGMVGQLIVK